MSLCLRGQKARAVVHQQDAAAHTQDPLLLRAIAVQGVQEKLRLQFRVRVNFFFLF